jgi:energy-coupling factor transporter ATP-binding protein EcfA2
MATKGPLKTLRIKQFRGSTKDFSLMFDSNKSLTLIYGENGSGKSTICDAFDFLGNGKVGSLEGRGLGQIHPFWPTVGQSHASILVEMSVDHQTWQARANAKTVSVTPAGIAPPKVDVLRRSSILRLVQDAPKEKYEALKPFIDISLVEQAEGALRNQIKDSSFVLNNAANRIAENRDTLWRLFKESGSAESSALAWAKKTIANPPPDPTRDVAALRAVAKAIEACISLQEQSVTAREEAAAGEAHLNEVKASLAALESAGQSSDAAFERILSVAKDHFAKHPVAEVCPLCESAERVTNLALHVDERLSKLKALTAARGAVTDAISKHTSKETVVQSLSARAKVSAAAAVEKVKPAPVQWAEKHPGALSQLQNLAQEGDLDSIDAELLRKGSDAASELCSALEGKKASFATVKTIFQQYQTNLDNQKVVSQVVPRLEAALVLCEQQRKHFLDSILSAIATEVGRLYEIIHPGEGLNKITLKLDPQKSGSLDLAAEFLSQKDQPPHAYFSESHLDSLGLCIFLALAALREPERTVVVMDDVLGSIDEPHVDRLIEMLYVESKKFKHTIITTHYQPWREKFRWGWLKNGQCELMELGVWDPSTGIATAKLSQAPLLELRQHLAATPPAIQPACASAGVLLEAICDYLTGTYECDVPRKKGKLTLGDMLPKVSEKKLADALRIEVKQADGSFVQTTVGDKLIQLRDMAQLRNIFGCHYNDLAHQLPHKDAIEFATLVHDVGSALICDEEGWPGSDKSGSYWATRNETRRLHPLRKPK